VKWAFGCLAGAALGLTACSHAGGATDGPTHTTTITHPASHAVRPSKGPLGSGPTTSAEASCPYLDTRSAASDVGVRMGRVTVQSRNGKPVGCRFYADQDPTYKASEHLPGSDQPVLQIAATRYTDATTAHNAMVTSTRAGTAAYADSLSASVEGISFQIKFDPADGGRDWAYVFRTGTAVVTVTTDQINASFNARAVAAAIVPRF